MAGRFTMPLGVVPECSWTRLHSLSRNFPVQGDECASDIAPGAALSHQSESRLARFTHRAEQKALLKATNELSESPDDVLSDIGISRDDITTFAFRSPASRRRG
ncbi:hypothetical protein NKI32_24675 [Mesorhizobium sp. M0761]|uniref:hypothetical protein n=1 Tax=Mesorhizobium sp. M0761 TaxID=2956994 RepID=UPI00333C7D5C